MNLSTENPNSTRKVKALRQTLPSTLLEDRQAFIMHADSKTNPLPHYFDRENWETFHSFKARVSHIYDPSKFWIVTKEKEAQLLQNYLYDYYSKHGQHYVIPENKRDLFLYCVAYSSSGVHYRGIIVNIPNFLQGKLRALVFCIDFGFIVPVELDQLFMFTKKLYSVPHLAIRASLAEVAPLDYIGWRVEDYKEFFNLVNGKLLRCEVMYIDKKRKVLDVCLVEIDSVLKQANSISDILVEQQVAVKMTAGDLAKLDTSEGKLNENNAYVVKLPFHLPPFEAIEWGVAPSSLITHENLKEYC